MNSSRDSFKNGIDLLIDSYILTHKNITYHKIVALNSSRNQDKHLHTSSPQPQAHLRSLVNSFSHDMHFSRDDIFSSFLILLLISSKKDLCSCNNFSKFRKESCISCISVLKFLFGSENAIIKNMLGVYTILTYYYFLNYHLYPISIKNITFKNDRLKYKTNINIYI